MVRQSLGIAVSLALCGAASAGQGNGQFSVEEATIAGIHAAIRSGQATCQGVVRAYLARAKAYNGVCTQLVTADGADVPAAKGYVRAGSPLAFPVKTVKASTVFPDIDQYNGLPLDLGRMEPTRSDPGVMHQMGMRVGIPNAGQLNALETLNVRGERSITCKGAFDAHPSTGPLPPGAPPACDAFRRQPDALERAAELDKQYGRNPDLAALPMYCVVTAFKDPYDTKDMRTTSGSDVNFAMDVPPFDSTVAARLRAKGAIVYAKSVAAEFNGGPGNPGGTAKAATNQVAGGQNWNSWSGQSCNPYDTERVPRGTSSGSGVAVSANLVTVSICEQSGASCQGPASRNGVALVLPTKGITPDSGGIGNMAFIDRAGIHARTLADATRVLDALKDPVQGYYDSKDPFTALARGLVPERPYASAIVNNAGNKPLKGVRIAILREHMVKRTANHGPIIEQMDKEFTTILRDKLGAELVETVMPGAPDDPAIPNVAYGFADAFSELLPRMMPEIFSRKTPSGELAFAVPGYDVTSYDYLLKLSLRQAPLTPELNITNFSNFGGTACTSCGDFRFVLDKYLKERGDTRVTDWPTWVANAKFDDDSARAGAENWAAFTARPAEGMGDRIARSHLGRMALMRVMRENRIDAFVHPENTVPTPKIQGPNVGTISLDGITPFLQIPRVVIPAGFTDVVYEPQYALNPGKTDYVSVLAEGTPKTKLAHPLPIAITFFAGQGDESALVKIGTAYEAATHHRAPPPAFGPLRADAPGTK